MKFRTQLFVALSLALGLVPTVAVAAEPYSVAATVLSGEGNVYQILSGRLGDLAPKSAKGVSDNPVLALDVIQQDGSHERSLVPGTEGPDVEGAPAAVFEDASARLYVVWESKKSPTVSRLLLASFDVDGWSDPIEISGDVSPLKSEPRMLIGHDRFSVLDTKSKLQSRNRTVIQVLWRQEGSAGTGLYYTPVILEAGKYIGWNPIVALTDLELYPPDPAGATGPSDLLRTPVLAPGQDIYSAIIAYLSPRTGRMVTVEVRLLPGELGFLADRIRADIIEIGNHDRGRIVSLAKSFRSEVVATGHQLNTDLVQHFADLARAKIVADYDADPHQPPSDLADRIRADIIEIGARLLAGPGNQGLTRELLQVGPEDEGPAVGSGNPGITHLLDLEVVADRPAPPLDGVSASIFVSEDGERVLVGWLSDGKVYYTESGEQSGPTGEVWTAIKHLTLSERLGVSEAAAILETRVERQR